MNITAMFKTRSFGACGIGVSLLIAQPCAAQQAACVYAAVGIWYVAEMGVKYQDKIYPGPSSFSLGYYRCVKLPLGDMKAGSIYNVVVSASAGQKSQFCSPGPSYYDPNLKNTLVYLATGTTWDVVCRMPLPENQNVIPSTGSTAPSKEEGLKPAPQ
ncbi:MAG: hypothetical protein ACLP4V_35475 [Methylocella sp.]